MQLIKYELKDLAVNKTIIKIKPFRKQLRIKTKQHAMNKDTITSLAYSNGSRKDQMDFCKLALKNNFSVLMKVKKPPTIKNIGYIYEL